MDRRAFDVYITQVLVPTLHPGQIVVLDNLSVHKSANARAAIEAAGCTLHFLPAYSPDFNPIEHLFSKIKAILRRLKARTRDALLEAIAVARDSITVADAQGWFLHNGYPLLPPDS